MVELQDGGLGSSGVFLPLGLCVIALCFSLLDISFGKLHGLAGLQQSSIPKLHHRLRLDLFSCT